MVLSIHLGIMLLICFILLFYSLLFGTQSVKIALKPDNSMKEHNILRFFVDQLIKNSYFSIPFIV